MNFSSSLTMLQRVIAKGNSAAIAKGNGVSVRPSVRLSVRLSQSGARPIHIFKVTKYAA